MKNLSKKEQEIVNIINKSNGLKFDSLLTSKLYGIKLTLNNSTKIVRIRYKTANFQPKEDEKNEIDKKSRELFERIFLAVTIINLLHNNGYIYLYSITKEIQDNLVIGDSEISDIGIENDYEDDFTKEFLFKYIGKIIIVNQALESFIKNGYRTNDEKRQIWSIRLTWIGIGIALFLGIYGVYLNYNDTNSELLQEGNDLNKQIINELKQLNVAIEKSIIITNEIDTMKNESASR